MVGKPCIRGMRTTVYDVFDYVASDMTEDEILHDFPDFTAEDIRACLAFAADRERRLAEIPALKLRFEQAVTLAVSSSRWSFTRRCPCP